MSQMKISSEVIESARGKIDIETSRSFRKITQLEREKNHRATNMKNHFDVSFVIMMADDDVLFPSRLETEGASLIIIRSGV